MVIQIGYAGSRFESTLIVLTVDPPRTAYPCAMDIPSTSGAENLANGSLYLDSGGLFSRSSIR